MTLRRSTRALAAAILIAALTLGACAGGDDSGSASIGGGGGGAEPAPRAGSDDFVVSEQDSAGSGGDVVGAAFQTTPLPGAGPRVIKRAHLAIEVPNDEFQSAIANATAIAGDHGGFILSTEVRDVKEGFGTVVLRVPAADFETALSAIKDLGDVKSDRASGEDVSEEFVDLEARLRNFSAQEAVLLRLMDRAETVVATIRVQRELTGVQLEIERIRGRLRFLEDQTSFGTITVDLNKAGAVVAKSSTLEKAWQKAGSVFLAILSGVVVSAGALLPVALLALVGLAVFKLVRPRFGSRTGSVEV